MRAEENYLSDVFGKKRSQCGSLQTDWFRMKKKLYGMRENLKEIIT
jgi:hypothetical protein